MGLMEFLARYTQFTVDNYGIRVLGNKPEMVAEMRALIRRVSMRRRAADVLPQMPPIFWHDTPIDVDPSDWPAELAALDAHPEVEQILRVIDAALADDTRAVLFGEESIVLATLRRLTGIAKARPVAKQIAAELMAHEYDKIVVFVWHKEAMQIAREVLGDFGIVVVRGGQSDTQRQFEIDQFQTNRACRVALVQVAAGYHTITLHAAAQVAFIEQAWTPDINAQAAKRAHRIGQLRPVRVRSFGLVGSIDDALTRVLVRKARAILELME